MEISNLNNVDEIKTELAIEAIEKALLLVRGLANTMLPHYNNNRAKLISPQLAAMVELVKTLRNEV